MNLKVISDRKIVVVNQASNYLTIGFCNAFRNRFSDVSLITGSIHVQGEELRLDIEVIRINMYFERPAYRKFFSYVSACIRIYFLLLFRFRKHEVFFVSVPPMAYLLNIFLPNRFSMVIWDVFPDAFKITGIKISHPVYKVWAYLNRFSYKKAYRLFTIGERMADLLEQYVERRKIIIQPIWSIFQSNGKLDHKDNPFRSEHRIGNKFVVQYSGNIGLSHKVEVMVDIADKMKHEPDINFQIIGRGPREPYLRQLVQKKNLPNCHFLPFQSDDMFPYSLSAADLGVVILDAETAKGSIPSKSYNLMSYGIPTLYIASADSELSNYAEKFNHAICFDESELDMAVAFILKVKRDAEYRNMLSVNAVKAAALFKRENADNFVERYING